MKIQKIKIKTKIVNQTIIKQMLDIPFLPILHVLTSCYHDPITFYQFYQQSNKQQVILTVKPTETQCSSSKLFQISAQRNCEKNQTNQSTSKAFDFKH